jgi:hypothetical protein
MRPSADIPFPMLRRKPRDPAQRLNLAVQALPPRTRVAMLHGIRDNDIVVGAYTDRESGGICPMLAAHRNGGRTNLASFARAWDRFTGASRPRLASDRELRALTSYLEHSLLRDEQGGDSLTVVAGRLRADRARREAQRSVRRKHAERTRRPTGERHRGRELRRRRLWSWIRPTRRYDVFAERIAAAEEQLAEQQAREILAHERV